MWPGRQGRLVGDCCHCPRSEQIHCANAQPVVFCEGCGCCFSSDSSRELASMLSLMDKEGQTDTDSVCLPSLWFPFNSLAVLWLANEDDSSASHDSIRQSCVLPSSIRIHIDHNLLLWLLLFCCGRWRCVCWWCLRSSSSSSLVPPVLGVVVFRSSHFIPNRINPQLCRGYGFSFGANCFLSI